MKTLSVMLVVLALGVVSCRQTTENLYQRGVESADRMMQQGDTGGACKQLLGLCKDRRLASRREDLQGRLVNCFVEHAKRLSASGQASEAFTQMESYITALPAVAALPMAGRVLTAMLDAGARRQAGEIPGLIERLVPDSVDRRGMLCEGRMALLIKDGKVKEAQDMYQGGLAGIPDPNALRGLDLLAAALPDGGAALSVAVMDASVGRRRVQESAAGLLIKTGMAQKDGAEIARRLVTISQKGLSVPFVIGQIDRAYQLLLTNPSAGDLAPLYAVCEKMAGAATDAGTRRRLCGYLLDMGYFMEKYAEALKLVENGALGPDNPQTEQFICKIKGHLALKEGRFDEAVVNFRKFMSFIEKETGPREMDPIDQTWVTREMILGLNARRIGDILVKAGKAQEAAAVYKEARGYYEKAIKDFPDPASKENQKIAKQMSEMPSA